MVNVGSLRRVEDLPLLILSAWGLFEESLADSLVDDDQSDVGQFDTLTSWVVLVSQDFLELIKLKGNNLLSHGIAYSVTIDEDLLRKST